MQSGGLPKEGAKAIQEHETRQVLKGHCLVSSVCRGGGLMQKSLGKGSDVPILAPLALIH
jgi:hypothetical protein